MKLLLVAELSGNILKDSVEIKQICVSENTRGKGIATMVLCELEKWAKKLEL